MSSDTFKDHDLLLSESYRKTDDCVFPYECFCEDCYEKGRFSAKLVSWDIDKEIYYQLLEKYKNKK